MRISDWSSDVCSSDLVGTETVPSGQLRRSGCNISAVRNNAHGFLTGNRLGPLGVPAVVELAFEASAPFGRGLMRGLGRTRRIIEKEWFFRRCSMLAVQPSDSMIDARSDAHPFD